jgi:hypothetical protein
MPWHPVGTIIRAGLKTDWKSKISMALYKEIKLERNIQMTCFFEAINI